MGTNRNWRALGSLASSRLHACESRGKECTGELENRQSSAPDPAHPTSAWLSHKTRLASGSRRVALPQRRSGSSWRKPWRTLWMCNTEKRARTRRSCRTDSSGAGSRRQGHREAAGRKNGGSAVLWLHVLSPPPRVPCLVDHDRPTKPHRKSPSIKICEARRASAQVIAQ